MTQSITHRIEQPQELAPSRINVASMLQEIVKAGLTSDSAAAVASLVQLQNQQEDRWAKQEWARAFAQARAKCGTIQAEKAVEIQGKTAFHYAPLPDLLDTLEPICNPLGLSISFDSKREGAIVTGSCIVYHTSGHSEVRSCAKSVASAKGLDPDTGAITTCQRKALCLMFALKVRHMDENDPRILGEFITPIQADELEVRCAALDKLPVKIPNFKAKLLKYLHANSFGEVYSSRLQDAERSITQAEIKCKTPTADAQAQRTGAEPPSSVQPSADNTTPGDSTGVTSRAPAGQAIDGQPASPAPVPSPLPSAAAPSNAEGTSEGHEPSMGVDDPNAPKKCRACLGETVVNGRCTNCMMAHGMTRTEARVESLVFAGELDRAGQMGYIAEATGSPDGSPMKKAYIKARAVQGPNLGNRGMAELLSGELNGFCAAVHFYILAPDAK